MKCYEWTDRWTKCIPIIPSPLLGGEFKSDNKNMYMKNTIYSTTNNVFRYLIILVIPDLS